MPDQPKAAPTNGPEPQTTDVKDVSAAVIDRQKELAPPQGVIQQGNEPVLGQDYDKPKATKEQPETPTQ